MESQILNLDGSSKLSKNSWIFANKKTSKDRVEIREMFKAKPSC